MSEREFDQLLKSISIGALSPEQIAALRRALTDKLLSPGRPKFKQALPTLCAKPRKPGKLESLTAFEMLSGTGLIGCVKGEPGSPTDLATNPVHMEGFGSG
jgi:hypothetical protein